MLNYYGEDNDSSKHKNNIRIVETHHIHYNMDKKRIVPIIEHILVKSCGMNVFGYNKKEDNYLCKIISKRKCKLFITVSIHSLGVGKVRVTIREKFGENNNAFKTFVDKFIDSMRLYVEFPIISEYLDPHLGTVENKW